MNNNFDRETDYPNSFNSETTFDEAFGSQTKVGALSFTSDTPFNTALFQHGIGSSDGISDLGHANLGPVVEQPNLFQQMGNLSEGSSSGVRDLMTLDDVDVIGLDDPALNHDSDEMKEESGIKGGAGDRDNSKGDRKGKRKYPAKNLKAERRRRERLKEKLLVLRSVVPNITKMDRASTLADAIAYIKHLKKKVNDLNLEIQAIPSSSAKLQPTAAASATTRLNSQTPAAKNVQPHHNKKKVPPLDIKIEVNQREEKTMNIHMLCGQKPGLMHSVTKTLDDLDLDIRQAVITNFDNFSLDVFQAKKGNEKVNVDQIKAKLMESAGYKMG